jgi:gluconolactonase
MCKTMGEMQLSRRWIPGLVALFFMILTGMTGMAADGGLLAPGAAVTTAQTGFNGTEGPAVDAEGNVYFTSRAHPGILKWNWADGKVSVIREDLEDPVGMAVDAKGRLVICEMGNGRLIRDDLNGNTEVLADYYNGQKLRPNDVWVDSKGGMYFSSGQIFYLSPDGEILTQVTSDIGNPNGVTGTPDGSVLYVGDTKIVYSYQIQPDGSLSGKKFFCNMDFSDGLKVDKKNHVYVTGDLLYIYTPQGELLEKIEVPERPKNMNFAGKDGNTLFITCPKAVYTLELAPND